MAVGDLELGPCQVLYGTAGAEVSMGKTEGGVIVTFNKDTVPLYSDQEGTAPEDEIVVGQGATIKVPLAEITLDNYATALGQTKTQNGSDYGVAGANLVGTSLRAAGQSLLLKKYVDGAVSALTENWIRFLIASPSGTPVEVGFSKDSQRILEITFVAFRDVSTGHLYYIGDETAAASGS